MKRLYKFLILCFSFLFAFTALACDSGSSGGNNSSVQKSVNTALLSLSDEDFTRAQLCGEDALGRTVDPVVGLKNKYVGLFYFVATGYMGEEDPKSVYNIYDLSKLLEKYPADKFPINASPITALSDSEYYNPQEAPVGVSYFWGKPLYDYYRSDDEWVIRKHLELFTYAGIDFLYLDYTNNVTYPEATKTLLKVIKQMQDEGYTPPKVMFFLHVTNPGNATTGFNRIIKHYYSTDEYDSCWFRGDKDMNPAQLPIVVGNFSGLEQKDFYDGYRDRLCLIEEQWPGLQHNENAIPWMDHNFPQKNHNGVMNVSVSQGGVASSEAYYNKAAAYKARGYDLADINQSHGYEEDGVMSGVNFDWQWNTVHQNADKIKMVTVTGWNEWIVTKLDDKNPAAGASGRASFIDSFNMAYSRDAEMMEGGYGDNYYMQIVENLRKFKGITVDGSDNVAKFDRKSINDLSDISVWDTARKYLDMGLSTVPRDWTLVDRSIQVTDNTSRNDIKYVQLLNDGDNLYVAVTCREEISKHAEGDANWMNLYLSCGGNGWEGYDFIINRLPSSDGKTSIEKLGSNGATEKKGDAKYAFAASGRTIVFSVPLSVLGVSENKVIGVKATDNLKKICDADEFMLHGDSAPMGRLNYAYKIA